MKTVPVPKSKSNNVKRKWLLGALLIGTLAKLWSVKYYDSLESYLLCSETNKIYTVDESRPRVECISVRGSRIIESGKLGNCSIFFLKCNSNIDENSFFFFFQRRDRLAP